MTYIVEYFEDSEIDDVGGRYRAVYVEAESVETVREELNRSTDGKFSKIVKITEHKKAS